MYVLCILPSKFQSNVKAKKQPVSRKKEDLLKNDEIEKNSLLLTIESLQSQVPTWPHNHLHIIADVDTAFTQSMISG